MKLQIQYYKMHIIQELYFITLLEKKLEECSLDSRDSLTAGWGGGGVRRGLFRLSI